MIASMEVNMSGANTRVHGNLLEPLSIRIQTSISNSISNRCIDVLIIIALNCIKSFLSYLHNV